MRGIGRKKRMRVVGEGFSGGEGEARRGRMGLRLGRKGTGRAAQTKTGKKSSRLLPRPCALLGTAQLLCCTVCLSFLSLNHYALLHHCKSALSSPRPLVVLGFPVTPHCTGTPSWGVCCSLPAHSACALFADAPWHRDFRHCWRFVLPGSLPFLTSHLPDNCVLLR